MSFSAIQDQQSAVGTLTRAVSTGRVPHAYLFQGPAGVGKRLAADALAMTMNCEFERDDACGQCSSCAKISRGNHPDVRGLAPPEGKVRIGIEQVREADRWLGVPAHEGRAKVLIIDPADGMTEPAANALLKTLEEPRPACFLVLVTSQASAMLPTIRSRCQVVRFRPLRRETVAALLREGGVSEDDAELVSSLAEGSMALAAELTGEELPVRMGAVMEILEGAAGRTPERGLEVAAALKGDRQETLAVLWLLQRVLNEMLWLRTGDPSEVQGSLLVARFGDRLWDLVVKGTPERAAEHIAAVNRAMTAMARNNMNPQLAVEGLLMTMRGRGTTGESWIRIGAK